MRSIKLRILLTVLLGLVTVFVTPTEALAVIQRLNGATGQTQTFQNDTNVTVSSLNNIHSLIWQGLLPVSRGGTGNDAFTEGSVIFMGQNKFRQDNNNFFWDRINNRLGIGTSLPTSTLDVSGDTSISGNLEIGDVVAFSSEVAIMTPDGIPGTPDTSTEGVDLEIFTGNGGALGSEGDFSSGGNLEIKTGNNGNLSLVGGDALGLNNNGGYIQLFAGDGANPQNQGGSIEIQGGDDSQNVGGDISLHAGNGITDSGDIVLSTDYNGNIELYPGSTGLVKIFDTALWASDQTYTFPNASGTFGLLEANQTWSGLNKFEASTNSTIYVGSSVKSGCIAIGDSDGNGITYITANDGALSASSTKPSICQ